MNEHRQTEKERQRENQVVLSKFYATFIYW